jgi:predicted component of type VI protein secretion system
MYDYNIGGQERKNEVNEGIADIPQNKTLLIERLTDEPPLSPQVIPDLKNLGEVFNFFQPGKEVEFDTEDGSSRTEKLEFRSLADFGKQGITRQSAFLNELNHQCDDLQKFIRQLKSNKILKSMLENKEAKNAYVSALQGMIGELEQAD